MRSDSFHLSMINMFRILKQIVPPKFNVRTRFRVVYGEIAASFHYFSQFSALIPPALKVSLKINLYQDSFKAGTEERYA